MISVEKLTTMETEDLMPLPWNENEKEWVEIPKHAQEDYTCILDDVCVLQIPKPKTTEEEVLVNKFINGMRKVFTKKITRHFFPC